MVVRQAYEAILPDLIIEREQARQELKDWGEANPGPKRPYNFHSNADYLRWKDLDDSHSSKWHREYSKLSYLAGHVDQLYKNIELALILERDVAEAERMNDDDSTSFFMRYGGVNCPLMCHGQRVFLALYRGQTVPPEVLAEWPDGVATVMKEISARPQNEVAVSN